MTDIHFQTGDAESIRERAADWLLEQRMSESWSTNNQQQLDDWLAQSPAHLLAYWRLDAIWGKTYRLKALRAPQKTIGAARPSQPRRADKLRSTFIKCAAALVVMAIFGVAANLYISPPRDNIYATAIGEHRVITLPDGSSVELNTDTVLRLKHGQTRSAILEKGEAYFQIRHDDAHPFVVTVGHHTVTDLGTAFTIRKETSRLEVTLLEGEARIDAPHIQVGPRSALLRPGDVVIATEQQLIPGKKSAAELRDELGWRHGVLIFKGSTLAAAAAEFNRYNSRKIYIADEKTARLTIGGTFQAKNIDSFTQATRDLFGLKIKQAENETVITR